ncbi:hypothetical protein [Mesorhizobium sp. CN2-181]|uniref:hypothetical protein n=1 Tax=Mesorhizobium yinganensis TaxID=3157707 RepID=UPI0032B87E35
MLARLTKKETTGSRICAALALPSAPAELLDADRVVAEARKVEDEARERARRADQRHMSIACKPGRPLAEVEEALVEKEATCRESMAAAETLKCAYDARLPALAAYEATARAELAPALAEAIAAVRIRLDEAAAIIDALDALDGAVKARRITLDGKATGAASTVKRLLRDGVVAFVDRW